MPGSISPAIHLPMPIKSDVNIATRADTAAYEAFQDAVAAIPEWDKIMTAVYTISGPDGITGALTILLILNETCRRERDR